MLAIRIEKQSFYLPLYQRSIDITSYPTNTITRHHMLLKTRYLTATLVILSLVFHFSIHEPFSAMLKSFPPAREYGASSNLEVRNSPCALATPARQKKIENIELSPESQGKNLWLKCLAVVQQSQIVSYTPRALDLLAEALNFLKFWKNLTNPTA